MKNLLFFFGILVYEIIKYLIRISSPSSIDYKMNDVEATGRIPFSIKLFIKELIIRCGTVKA